MARKSTLKVCKNGHRFYKKTDCPTCPIYEATRKPKDNFLALLAAPARRALERANIFTLNNLAQYSEKELLALHGMGKSSIATLQALLLAKGLTFRN